MATEFGEFVQNLPCNARELPLVHNTKCSDFATLAADHKLEPLLCDVFHEMLVYLFYGRPAYRPMNLPAGTTLIESYPICLVFHPDVARDYVSRVFPCDTGALNAGLFAPMIEPPHLPHYEMEPAIASARRLVEFLYEDNDQYFVNEAPKPVELAAAPATVKAYKDLLDVEGDTQYDDRRSAIEIQSNKPVPLPHNLLAVILPFGFLEDEAVRTTIVNEWRALPVGYAPQRGGPLSDCYAQIRTEMRRVLEAGGYL